MITSEKVDKQANTLTNQIDTDFLSNIEFLILDQAEAFVFQNMEHLDEVMQSLNKKPKKLTQMNDITRLKDIYTHNLAKKTASGASTYSQLFRQNIVIQKFRNIDLQAALDQHCSHNVFGRVTLPKI